MRLVTHVHEGSERPGALVEHDGSTRVVDLAGVAATTLDILTDAALAAAARAAVDAADPAGLPALDDVRLAPPVRPGQVLAVGYNYEGHRGPARDGALPTVPNVFVKTRNALSGPHDAVTLPRVPAEVDYEGEIAVVVGRRMQDVAEADVLDHVAGYTLYDDVTARDRQHATSQWTLGKNFDGFGQLGPAVVTVDEAGALEGVELTVERDGAVVARATTAQMVFPVARLLHLLSQVVPLEPGDVVATGSAAKTPEASASHVPMADGDAVTITATGLGSLTTRFVAPGSSAPHARGGQR